MMSERNPQCLDRCDGLFVGFIYKGCNLGLGLDYVLQCEIWKRIIGWNGVHMVSNPRRSVNYFI